jgi:stage III sporulation protein AG
MYVKENGFVAKITKFLRKDNNLSLAIAGVAGIAIIAFILTSLNTGSQPQAKTDSSSNQQTAAQSKTGTDLETQLEQILTQVQGAGQVQVMVTYESGPEIVPAVKTDTQNSSTDSTSGQNTTSTTQNSEPVTVQGKDGTEPMVLLQKEPVVLGVLVVAEGASNLEVRLRLMEAVQVALQIAPDRIEVLPMNITQQNREGN